MTQVKRIDYRVVEDVLSSFPCARALHVYLLVKYGEFDQLVELKFNPFDYNDEQQAAASLFATEFLRKAEFLPTTVDKEANARQSFLDSERVCEESNARLAASNWHAEQLFVASRKIQSVLGHFSPEEMIELSGWGPGATVLIKGRDATPFNKFRHKGEATLPLWSFMSRFWSAMYPTWQVNPKLLEGNKVIQVPKNSKTNRTIAIEPSLNLWFQKGIGKMIRRRLSRYEVYLNDQTVNQRLAREGSITGELTTVDFSSASDTIPSRLVLDLLPFPWFEALDLLRSPRGYHDGALLEYEKFSSMGNGFTFELESLIFWALAQACVPDDHPLRHKISVYGDDVIIPTDCYSAYVKLCEHCGFTINQKKSFCSGYYRESCGKHYWMGSDISPVYFRKTLATDSIQNPVVMGLHNRLVEYSISRPQLGSKGLCGAIRALRRLSAVKHASPFGYGDSGLITSWDVARPSFERTNYSGWLGRRLHFTPKEQQSVGHEVLLTRLTCIGTTDTAMLNSCTVPRVGRYAVVKHTYPSWPSFSLSL